MTWQRRCPEQLLTQPVVERLRYFQQKVIAHPRLQEVHDALLQVIRDSGEEQLILVFGSTGIGKTTLRLRLQQMLINDAADQIAADPGHIPVVGVDAIAAENGRFNWRDYYRRALMALDEPLIGHKILIQTQGVRRTRDGQLTVPSSVKTDVLRQSLEQCLAHRKPKAFFIDEAQHLQKIASGRRLLDQMDTLKSLAATTATRHILMGTYELLGLANLSAQLSRRTVEIHFPRYHLDRPADLIAYRNILHTFESHLPLVEASNLLDHVDYLYEHSVGCVGILKNWLNRTLAQALAHDEQKLTTKRLQQTALSMRQLLQMAREIREGEERFKDSTNAEAELRRLLHVVGQATTPEQPAHQKRGQRVQRNPVRDPVGEEVHHG